MSHSTDVGCISNAQAAPSRYRCAVGAFGDRDDGVREELAAGRKKKKERRVYLPRAPTDERGRLRAVRRATPGRISLETLLPGSVHLRNRRVCHQRGTLVYRKRTTLQKANDAKQRAAQASEPSIKSAYEKMAEYWMLLARIESLLHDEKSNEDA